MRWKTLKIVLQILAVGGLLFIAIGDSILPDPFAEASLKTRNNVTQFLADLFPDWEPKDPSQRTKEAIDQQEQNQ